MEVVVTTGAISRAKLQSDRHHQQTNIQFFLQAGCPSCRPTNSVKALKVKISHSTDLLTPSSPGVFQLCLWPLIAPGCLGEIFHASHQPSDASTPSPCLHSEMYFLLWCNIRSKSAESECSNRHKGAYSIQPSKWHWHFENITGCNMCHFRRTCWCSVDKYRFRFFVLVWVTECIPVRWWMIALIG